MLNQYLNNHYYYETNDFVENLQIEFIQARGAECFYIPRTYVNVDDLFGEDTLSKFLDKYKIEMFMESFGAWEGNGLFMSKFGMQDQRQMELIVSRKRFEEEVTAKVPDIKKPQVGDIIYSDVYGATGFSILYVEEYSLQQRQLNQPYTWKITVETLKYSHEDHLTGIERFDNIAHDYKNNDTTLRDPEADNKLLEDIFVDDVKNFDVSDPFGGN